jgi:hypothetical protein
LESSTPAVSVPKPGAGANAQQEPPSTAKPLKLLRAQDVNVQLPGFTQILETVIAINLEGFGKAMGIQPSGFLGFETFAHAGH